MGTVKRMKVEGQLTPETSEIVRFVMEHSWPARHFYAGTSGKGSKSMPHVVGKANWYIMLHPKVSTLSDVGAANDNLVVFLCHVRPEGMLTSHPIQVRAKIGIVGKDDKLMADASTTLNYVLPKDGSPDICDYSSPCVLLPSDKFIRIPYLRERLEVSDNLKLRAEVECSVLDSTSFQQSFRGLHESPVGRDFTLVSSDGTEKLVHKAILIARSPVFSAMFESSLSESQTGRCTIDDVTSSVLDILVKYMYCGCSDKDVTENTKEVLLAADKYQLTALVKQCELNLIDKFTEGNIVDMLLLTDGVAAPALKDAAFRYIKTNSAAMKSAGVVESLCEQGSPQLVAEIVTYLLPA